MEMDRSLRDDPRKRLAVKGSANQLRDYLGYEVSCSNNTPG